MTDGVAAHGIEKSFGSRRVLAGAEGFAHNKFKIELARRVIVRAFGACLGEV